jgi:hypothetical protein
VLSTAKTKIESLKHPVCWVHFKEYDAERRIDHEDWHKLMVFTSQNVNRVKAVRAGNEVARSGSGFVLTREVALKLSGFNPPAGQRSFCLHDQSPPSFAPAACGVSCFGQDPSPTGRRENTL